MVLGFRVCFAFCFSAKFSLAVSPTNAQHTHGEQAVGGSGIFGKSKDVQTVWPVVAQACLGFLLVEAAYFQKLKGCGLAPGSDPALPLWHAGALL